MTLALARATNLGIALSAGDGLQHLGRFDDMRTKWDAHTKRVSLVALVISATSMLAACGSDDADSDSADWLFVQTAESAEMPSDTTLVMPVTREIFGFTDRPNRDHLYMDAEGFVSLWGDDVEDGFGVDPPNTVMTWNDDGELSEAELIVSDAVLSDDGSAITYTVAVEAGSLPDGELGPVSLFVDASMGIQAMQYQRKILSGK